MKQTDNFQQSMNELLTSKFVFVNAKDVLRIINKHIPIELVGKRKNKAKVVGAMSFSCNTTQTVSIHFAISQTNGD